MTVRDRIALSRPVLAVGTAVLAATRYASVRVARPRLAMLACPLAVIPFMLGELWWLALPLFIGSWWWADRSWRWTWIIAIECASFGTVWAYSFSEALAQFANSRMVVGCIWSFAALSIAIVSLWSRRQRGSQDDYPGY